MPRFVVYKTITALHSAYVEAETEDEVFEMVDNNEIDFDFDGQDDTIEVQLDGESNE